MHHQCQWVHLSSLVSLSPSFCLFFFSPCHWRCRETWNPREKNNTKRGCGYTKGGRRERTKTILQTKAAEADE
ncbi:MAG: hypothetical protein J3R72DRAFT_463398, partial [Linnemannia gamsii]